MDLDVEDCKNAFKQLLGYHKIDELIDPCHQKGIYGDLEEGTMSAEDFRAEVLRDRSLEAVQSLWMRRCGIYFRA